DMTDSEGGFYSAEDADSEGEEGTFYLWEPEQVASILGRDEAKLFNAHYGLTKRGNFEKGKTILSIVTPTEELAKELGMDHAEVVNILARARAKAFRAREERERPHRDDKVITGWNGLMISSLARGGAILKKSRYTEAARRSAEFILRNLHGDGRLKRYYRDGHVVGEAFLDDYAFMVIGLMDLYEATFDAKWLNEAGKLCEEMIEFFADTEQGGFFLAGKDGEKLIARTKPGSDGAIPSGNSAAAFALLKLGRLMMNQQSTDHGVSVLETFSGQLEQSPAYSSLMLEALSLWLGPVREIVIAGSTEDEDTRQMLEVVRSRFMPEAVVLFHDQGNGGSALEEIIPFVKTQIAIGGKATAYVCENYACKKPVHDIRQFESLLDQTYERPGMEDSTDDEESE
ncbi:MAG: thioredoxin domain-containing protein, partial [Phycisphaerales bacterium]